MLVEDALDGLAVERAVVPYAVGLGLHFSGIEIGQHILQFIHHAVRVAVAEHLQQVQLNRVEKFVVRLS